MDNISSGISDLEDVIDAAVEQPILATDSDDNIMGGIDEKSPFLGDDLGSDGERVTSETQDAYKSYGLHKSCLRSLQLFEKYMSSERHRDFLRREQDRIGKMKRGYPDGEFHEQGRNTFGCRQTCGYVSVANAINHLNRKSNVPVVTEDEVVAYGFYSHIIDSQRLRKRPNWSENMDDWGGADQVDLKDLIRGVSRGTCKTDIFYPRPLKSGQCAEVTEQYEKFLDEGKILIIDVNYKEFARGPKHLIAKISEKIGFDKIARKVGAIPDEVPPFITKVIPVLNRLRALQKSGDHWITIVNAVYDDGVLEGFDIIDTSGGDKPFLSLGDLEWAHTKSKCPSCVWVERI